MRCSPVELFRARQLSPSLRRGIEEFAMSSFGNRVDGPGGRRGAVRSEVTIVGSAVTLEGSRSVLVEDLCPTGAKLVGHDLPPPGAELLLRTDELAALGRVAWASSDYRGIEFERDLATQP
jgi:hypothetical protein